MLANRVDAAFADGPAPAAGEMLAAPYASSVDAIEMGEDFKGKRWRELPVQTLARHREMLIALSPAAYRAYVPAYLKAGLGDSQWAHDLRQYTLFSLMPVRPDRSDEALVRARLAALSREQRDVIEAFVREACLDEKQESKAVLDYWKTAKER